MGGSVGSVDTSSVSSCWTTQFRAPLYTCYCLSVYYLFVVRVAFLLPLARICLLEFKTTQ